jgi:hypothetical protein
MISLDSFISRNCDADRRPDPASIHSKCEMIVASGGSLAAKRPPIAEIDAYEGKSVLYAVREVERFRGRRVAIVGGCDSPSTGR